MMHCSSPFYLLADVDLNEVLGLEMYGPRGIYYAALGATRHASRAK